MQLPTLAIETVNRREVTPFQLGGGSYVSTDVLFHVVAETEFTRDKILDIVSLQKEKTITLFNPDRIGRNNAYPLDWRGSPNPSGLRYPELVAPSAAGGYEYRPNVKSGHLRFKDSNITSVTALNPNLYHGTVRTSTEVILPGI